MRQGAAPVPAGGSSLQTVALNPMPGQSSIPTHVRTAINGAFNALEMHAADALRAIEEFKAAVQQELGHLAEIIDGDEEDVGEASMLQAATAATARDPTAAAPTQQEPPSHNADELQ
jgi:hypothetical protein